MLRKTPLEPAGHTAATPAPGGGDAIDAQLTGLADDGYAVVRDVVDDVEELLQRAMAFFDTHAVAEMPASAILADDRLAGVLFGDAVVSVYRRVFQGPPVLFPNVSIRRNLYTPWHVDRGFVGKGSYLRDPGFRPYQFGVYLNAGRAPVLDVRPGSQVLLRRCPFRTTGLIDAYSYLLATRYRPVTLADVGPRDLLIWDGRVFHRGTPRGEALPAGTEKLALYWSMSDSHAEHETVFMRHLVGRGHRRRGLERFAKQANTDRYRELETLDATASLHPSVRGRVDELVGAGALRIVGPIDG